MNKVAELANYLAKKYANKPSKGKRTCVCENDACEVMGMHDPGKCKGQMFSGNFACPTGYICDECAMYFPKQYLTSGLPPEEEEEEVEEDVSDCFDFLMEE